MSKKTLFNPFPGLRSFEPEEDYLFFGREIMIDELLKRLRTTRFVAVVGASGSGKSSLVKAGLIPSLHGGYMVRTGSSWRVAIMRPGQNPIGHLASALSHDGVVSTDNALDNDTALAIVETTLRSSDLGLTDSIRQAKVSTHDNVLVVVDQFEELFRFKHGIKRHSARDDALAFVKLLLQASRQVQQPIYVVLTMRSDFMGNCIELPGLPEAVNDGLYLVPALDREQLRKTITGPIAVGGGSITPRLVLRLLNDAKDDPDQLPILQHAMMRLWDHCCDLSNGSTTIDIHHYEDIGTLTDALSHHAEEAYAELRSEGERFIAEKLFKALTEKDPEGKNVRRPVPIKEVCDLAGTDLKDVTNVVDHFRELGRSFLMPSANTRLGEDSVIDLSHESLMRQWARLDRWVDEERSAATTYQRLEQTALLWKRGHAALWSTPDLENAIEWKEHQQPNTIWAERYGGNFELAIQFLDASAQHRKSLEDKKRADRQRELDQARSVAEAQQLRANAERQRAEDRTRSLIRLRRLTVTLVAVTFVALGAATYAWLQKDLAKQHAQFATSGRLAAAALSNLDVDPERSLLLALYATSATYKENKHITAETENALHQAIQASNVRLSLGHNTAVNDAIFSPDGLRIATASADGIVNVWDFRSGKLLLNFAAHMGGCNGIVFTPDSKRIVTAGVDHEAKLWDATSGSELLVLRGHKDSVTAVAVSPDGKRLATASKDTTTTVWDAHTGDELLKLHGHTYHVTDVVFSPDGGMLATASGDRTVVLWDTETGSERIPPITGHGDAVLGLAFNKSGNRLATASTDKTVRIWDSATGELVDTLPTQTHNITDVSYSPDEKRLAIASRDGTAKVWEISPKRELYTLRGHTDFIEAVAFSPDGMFLVTASGDRSVKVWEPAAGELLKLAGHGGMVINVAFGPSGERLATASGDNSVILWDIKSGSRLQKIDAHASHVNDVAFSPNGSYLATAGGDTTAKLWDINSGQEIATLRGHKDAIFGVSFSPTGSRLATGSFDKLAKVWDIDSGIEVFTLSGHTGGINDVVYNPTGSSLVTTSDDGTAKIWDATSGKQLLTLDGHTDLVTGAAFNPDGTRVATASRDGTVILWDSFTGEKLVTLFGHTNTVFGVAFAPDGKRLATTSWDKTTRIWDTYSGEELLTLFGHTDAVNGVAFSPDGNRLATASWDKTVQLYAVEVEELMNLALSRVTRLLSTAECRNFLHKRRCQPPTVMSSIRSVGWDALCSERRDGSLSSLHCDSLKGQ